MRNIYDYSDNVSWVTGRNTITFGGSFERSQNMFHYDFSPVGLYTFGGMVTGAAVSDFLTGKMNQFNQGVGQYLDAFNDIVGMYVQDNFKAARRLTLNLGLRYEPYFPWHDQWNRVEVFELSAFGAGKRSTVFPNALPGEFFPGDPGVPSNGTTGSYKDFAPRFGFAYDVQGNGKTSIRGRVGVFYDTTSVGAGLFPMAMRSPGSRPISPLTPPPGTFSNPLKGIVSPFPAPFPPPSNFVFPVYPAITTFDPSTNYHAAVTYNWEPYGRASVRGRLAGPRRLRWQSFQSHLGNHQPESRGLHSGQHAVDQSARFCRPGTARSISSARTSMLLTMPCS